MNNAIRIEISNINNETHEHHINLKSLLSSKAIYILIHPAISNLFYEKMSFASSNEILKYVVDFENLDKNINNNRNLFNKTMHLSNALNNTKKQLEECLNLVNDNISNIKTIGISDIKNK